MADLTPREIVAELDRHIIGQDRAKRAVAVAVRNRWRRQQLDADLAAEVAPKNIIMIGPTGVGKTEIARRLSTLVGAPFVKVEASKYTEVGYHGRDVESMIRDLLEIAITMVGREHATTVQVQAEAAVETRLVNLLLGTEDSEPSSEEHDQVVAADSADPISASDTPAGGAATPADDEDVMRRIRERMAERLREGTLDDREIEVTIRDRGGVPMIGGMGPDQVDPGLASLIENLAPAKTRRRRVTVSRARDILLEEETERLVDNEKVIEQAIERTEQTGLVFLDEIDKIAVGEGARASADVSRQGVQRDLLPIVEGSTVTTRHGAVRTDRILFIAAGAFHVASVSDLMPELQGRFPIRVELDALTHDDFRRILTEPDAALTRQQVAMMGTEGLDVRFDDDAIDAIAELAAEANGRLENIGARRLITVMECVFEEIAFDAPERAARGERDVHIDAGFVRERVRTILGDEDLSRFVL